MTTVKKECHCYCNGRRLDNEGIPICQNCGGIDKPQQEKIVDLLKQETEKASRDKGNAFTREMLGFPQQEKEEWEDSWNTIWKPLLYTDGKLDIEKIKNEIHDLWFIYRQVAEVYEYITGGMLSKEMYYADTIKTAFDDEVTEQAKKQAEEELEEMKENLLSTQKEQMIKEFKGMIDDKTTTFIKKSEWAYLERDLKVREQLRQELRLKLETLKGKI